MIKYIRNIIYLLCIMLILQGCTSGGDKGEHELTGKILWPAANDKGNTSIYCANTVKSLTQPEAYYENSNYSKLCYPSKMNDAILLVGQKKVNNDYEIIMLKEKRTVSLMSKKDEILFPTAYNDTDIIYLGKNKEQSYIGLYSINSNTDSILFAGDVDLESKPAVTSSGEILFVKKDGNKYIVCLMDKSGNQRNIISGHYPLWLDNGRQFIYYYDSCIRKYNLENNNSEIIKRNITVTGTPVISPNKKFIALFERKSVAAIGGESIDYLRVMPLNGGKMIDVKAYLDAGYIYNWGGLEWIDEEG